MITIAKKSFNYWEIYRPVINIKNKVELQKEIAVPLEETQSPALVDAERVDGRWVFVLYDISTKEKYNTFVEKIVPELQSWGLRIDINQYSGTSIEYSMDGIKIFIEDPAPKKGKDNNSYVGVSEDLYKDYLPLVDRIQQEVVLLEAVIDMLPQCGTKEKFSFRKEKEINDRHREVLVADSSSVSKWLEEWQYYKGGEDEMFYFAKDGVLWDWFPIENLELNQKDLKEVELERQKFAQVQQIKRNLAFVGNKTKRDIERYLLHCKNFLHWIKEVKNGNLDAWVEGSDMFRGFLLKKLKEQK